MYKRETPFFSWSPLREKMFNECELCYLLYYYTSYRGWINGHSTEANASYRWKHARTMDELMNMHFINELVEEVYKEESFSANKLESRVFHLMNKAITDSVDNKEQWFNKPKSVDMLYELVYEDKIDGDHLKHVSSRLATLIKNFLKTQLVKDLSTGEFQLVEVRQLFKGGFAYYEEQELGIRVYANVQIVHKNNEGKYIATLIQTEDEKATLSQIGAVANIVAQKLNIQPTDIVVREEYLLSNKFKDTVITNDFLELTHHAMVDSVKMMSGFLVDNDIERNEFVGFKHSKYTCSIDHSKRDFYSVPSNEMAYCQAVKQDLRFFPEGYDNTIYEIIRKIKH